MTAPTLTTPKPEPTRDRWGRPLVVPPDGGKPVAYTRCTTFVGAVEDTTNLTKWKMRQVALGLTERPDLALAVAAHSDDKAALNRICDDALEASRSSAAATTGTALHALTERMDRGVDVGTVPPDYLPDLAAYAEASADLRHVQIEQFGVLDSFKVAGTWDRLVEYQGRRYIADLKTGSVEYGFGKIAAQLAVYARATPYDVGTDTRGESHGADLSAGIVIHLPAGSGTCRLYWVDLARGWEIAQTARDVREKRAHKFRDVFQELTSATAPPVLSQQLTLVGEPEPVDVIAPQIAHAANAAELGAIWRANRDAWTPEHTAQATERKRALGIS